MKRLGYFTLVALALIVFSFPVSDPELQCTAKPLKESTISEREDERQEMVEEQILFRGIKDENTIRAMLVVPRHLFVPQNLKHEAYADYPLPIGYGQTISQPYIVALMTASLELQGNEKALEVGTGSGYQAAVLAEIVNDVYTVEIIPELAQRAETTLKETGYTNVTVKNADGYYGWEEQSPFDVIIITAAVDHIPPPLIQQLKEGGRLILPLGNPLYYQTLTLVKKEESEIYTKHITDVRFVPMTGYAQEKEIEKETEPEGAEEKTEDVETPESYEEAEGDKEKEEKRSSIVLAGLLVLILGIVLVIWKIKKSKDRNKEPHR